MESSCVVNLGVANRTPIERDRVLTVKSMHNNAPALPTLEPEARNVIDAKMKHACSQGGPSLFSQSNGPEATTRLLVHPELFMACAGTTNTFHYKFVRGHTTRTQAAHEQANDACHDCWTRRQVVGHFDLTVVGKFALDPWLMLIRAGLAEHDL